MMKFPKVVQLFSSVLAVVFLLLMEVNATDPPHYYGPYPNYANSPLRMPDAVVTISGGGGSGATADAFVDPVTGAIEKILITNPGSGYTSAPNVDISSFSGGAGTGAIAIASIASGAIQDITLLNPGSGYMTPGVRKFLDELPLPCDPAVAPGCPTAGKYIPYAVPDTTTYPDADYYEIAVVQYRTRFSSDLPPTLVRGYVQLETAANAGVSQHFQLFNTKLNGTQEPILLNNQPVFGVTPPQHFGPVILASKGQPVRVLFRNLLPAGADGNLFLPVDTTTRGAGGVGPDMTGPGPDQQNPLCSQNPKPAGCFAENRATLHLQGGITPWISDGTPHQWTTPEAENTSYPEGVSVQNVPDMPDPGPGALTFFYSNQQSARLMFYHDQSWGITRLNVYAGEAAGYLLRDSKEQVLTGAGGPLEGMGLGIPLIIQDKTFVPNDAQLALQDPTWDKALWGGEGNLWAPHVYMPVQNPDPPSGNNPFGRWVYGPWYLPDTLFSFLPLSNPYSDPNCDPNGVNFCEPADIPGTPNLSAVPDAFNDTPVVNGTAYPTITLDPRAYRFRVLNAANDRFWNLSWYVADPTTGTLSEVALNPTEVAAAQTDPNVFPTPDTTLSPAGPNWVQIGGDGGFLPDPVVIPPQPTTWITDPTRFDLGNVDLHSLLLGPAERADVVVDFSRYRGKTLILYNDAPAAFPDRIPSYDYYTGGPDFRPFGAPSTPPGYGPNTRTVMQVKVSRATAATPFDVLNTTSDRMGALRNAFRHHPDGSGIFESGSHPIIVGQAPYNTAYGTNFAAVAWCNSPTNPTAKCDGYARVMQQGGDLFKFDTLSGAQLAIPLKGKAVAGDMIVGNFDEYGRETPHLGVTVPGSPPDAQQVVEYPYVNPVTEVIDGSGLPKGLNVTRISSATDGTQIWKITNNGVNTQPIHFHLFNVQLLNRVSRDNIIITPEPNELGWKDTIRVNPRVDTVLALRPVIPVTPFGIAKSMRLLNPMTETGSTEGFNNTDTNGNEITPGIINEIVDFGWEYLWNGFGSAGDKDMMRPISLHTAPSLPAPPILTASGSSGSAIALSWTDGTPVSPSNLATWGRPDNEIGFRIERAIGTGAFEIIGEALANVTSFTDKGTVAGSTNRYRVVAYNAVGDSLSAIVTVGPPPPAAPTNLAGTLQFGPRVTLTFSDNSTDETGFVVERSVNGGAFNQLVTLAANSVSYIDTTVTAGRTHAYRVKAVNGALSSGYSNTYSVSIPPAPAAPTSLVAGLLSGPQAQLTWQDNASNETGFVIERRINGGAFSVLTTVGPKAGVGYKVSYTDGTVLPGNTYAYRVKAANATSASTYSNSSTVVAAPAAPSNLTATAALVGTSDTVTLIWRDNSNNETSHTLQRSTDGSFGNNVVTVNNIAANSTTFSQTGVPRGRTFYYRIRAVNGSGASPWSNVASVTTP